MLEPPLEAALLAAWCGIPPVASATCPGWLVLKSGTLLINLLPTGASREDGGDLRPNIFHALLVPGVLQEAALLFSQRQKKTAMAS